FRRPRRRVPRVRRAQPASLVAAVERRRRASAHHSPADCLRRPPGLLVTPLPYSSPEHQRAHQFLVEEAHLLDSGRWDEWLELLTDDVTYLMPARVTVAAVATEQPSIDHFAEDRYSLRKRVERMATAYA